MVTIAIGFAGYLIIRHDYFDEEDEVPKTKTHQRKISHSRSI